MHISLSLLRLFKKKERHAARPEEALTVWLLCGLGTLIVFLTVLVAVDGYLFYFVRMRTGAANDMPPSSATLTPREIDEVIELLDQREQEFNTLLNP